MSTLTPSKEKDWFQLAPVLLLIEKAEPRPSGVLLNMLIPAVFVDGELNGIE